MGSNPTRRAISYETPIKPWFVEVLEYKNTTLAGELAVCEYSLGNDSYAIGFRKENEKLRDDVNEAIKKLVDNGKAEEISKKWFGKNIVIFEEI